MDVRKSSAWHEVETAEAYKNGAWRPLKYGEAYYSGSWRTIITFVPAMTLAISPSSALASSTSARMSTAANSVATPTGGQAPYTYAWTLLSSDDLSSIVITSPSSSSTKFTATVTTGAGTSGTATFRCTCTDALGTTATDDVTATFSHRDSLDTGGNL